MFSHSKQNNWLFVLFFRKGSHLRSGPAGLQTSDQYSVQSSPPKPLISWWIPVVHCLMQNEISSADLQSKVCSKNMGQMQVCLSLEKKRNKLKKTHIFHHHLQWNCCAAQRGYRLDKSISVMPLQTFPLQFTLTIWWLSDLWHADRTTSH